MKIQLDVKALERLIAGNSETELQLRSAVVQEFAKRHLRSVANSPEFRKFIEDQMTSIRFSVEEEMKTVFTDLRRDSWGRVTRDSFKKEVSAKIREEAGRCIDLQISKTVQDLVNARLDKLNDTVSSYCDSMIGKYTTRTLDEMVDAKFRALLQAVSFPS